MKVPHIHAPHLHPVRSALDHLVTACEYCDGQGVMPDRPPDAPAMCQPCGGSGLLPVEPLRVCLDYLARRLDEVGRDEREGHSCPPNPHLH